MIKVSILYSKVPHTHFNERYYLDVHIPLSVKLQGAYLKAIQVDTALTGAPAEAQPPYVAICHFYYASLEHFFAAFLPNRAVLEADMQQYTNIHPLVQMSEVRIDSLQGIDSILAPENASE